MKKEKYSHKISLKRVDTADREPDYPVLVTGLCAAITKFNFDPFVVDHSKPKLEICFKIFSLIIKILGSIVCNFSLYLAYLQICEKN